MSGFHFSPSHVLADFKAPLKQIKSYLDFLSQPDAPSAYCYSVTEIALDMLDFCALQEQLTPVVASHSLSRIESVMLDLFRTLNGSLGQDPSTKLAPSDYAFIACQGRRLGEVIYSIYGLNP